MFNDKSLVSKMLEAGASGYILKNKGKEEIVEAIHKVSEGETYFSSEISLTMIKTTPAEIIESPDCVPLSRLSEREVEILTMIVKGSTSNAISKKLFLSKRTVDTHRYNIMKKLGILNMSGLIRYAIKNGLI